MKKLSLFLLLVVFFVACNENTDKVKVVKNYDIEYLTENRVDQAAGTKEQVDSAMADLKYTVADAAKDGRLPVRANISFRMYVNKSGTVDAVKMLAPSKDEFDNKDYSYIDSEELMDAIASAASNWKFTPALLNGEPVNFQKDVHAFVTIESDGSMKIELPWGKSKPHNFYKSDEYFVVVEQQPYPIGGLDSLQAKIEYPEIAKRAGIEGKVFIKAYIDEKGNVVDAGVIKGIGAGCDEAALKAVQETKFIPGMQRGKPVKVQVSIPIIFKLQ